MRGGGGGVPSHVFLDDTFPSQEIQWDRIKIPLLDIPVIKEQRTEIKNMTTPDGWQAIVSTSFFPTAFTLFQTNLPATTLNQIPYANLFLACAITPDGKKIYVADRNLATVTVLDAKTFSVIKTIVTPSAGAVDIISSPPSFQRIYVSNQITGVLTVISTATDTVLGNVNLGGSPNRVAITPDGSRLFVGQSVGGLVLILDALTSTSTPTLLASVLVGGKPGATSITPNGQTAYTASATNSTLTIIDIKTLSTTGIISFPGGSGTFGSSILPNGSLLFATNLQNNTVGVVNMESNLIVATIALSSPVANPFWMASTPDSKIVFVIDQASHIIPIDTNTLLAGTPLVGSGIFQDIVISADPSPVASFAQVKTCAQGRTVLFDASASFSPIGSLTAYFWDFGDGITVTSSNSIISHMYQRRGRYTVTLRVQNSANTSTTQVWSSRFLSNFGSPAAQTSQEITICSRKKHSRWHDSLCCLS